MTFPSLTAADRYAQATLHLMDVLHEEFSCWDEVERFERSEGLLTDEQLGLIKIAWEATGGQ